MVYGLAMFKAFYSPYGGKIGCTRAVLQHPLTLAEEILYARLYDERNVKSYRRSEDYMNFRPDRVAMQDATAQMTLLRSMNSGRNEAAVPSTVHCDHLIQVYKGAKEDIATTTKTNEEVYRFLRSVFPRYDIGFWQPGADIIHQAVLENYAFPGGMMIDTDSHILNAGGLGMVAIGIGGANAVDVMIGMEWKLKIPHLIGVHLTGSLSGWAVPKDVILKLAGTLIMKGGTNAVIEYFGPGTASLSTIRKAMIYSIGAEVGATTSSLPYSERMVTYLKVTGREEVVNMITAVAAELRADGEVVASPQKYYDHIIDIDFFALGPYTDRLSTPDAATPISESFEKVLKNGYPRKVGAELISSCANSSYQDLSHAVPLARQVTEKNLRITAPLTVNPGSERICATAERDGTIGVFEEAGATITANAYGPYIGQWKRATGDPIRKNSIVASFSRNSVKRADDNPNTYASIASSKPIMALTITGNLCFNPLKDMLISAGGKRVRPSELIGGELPPKGFMAGSEGYTTPSGVKADIVVDPRPQRLQLLTPFPAWNGEDLFSIPLLIKTQGKCITDHISMAGPWLCFRGHLENILDNMLMGTVNAFSSETSKVWNRSTDTRETASGTVKLYKSEGIPSIVVAEESCDEGSSRGHAAMEPRPLNVRVIPVKSSACIHETNLKKRGMLALTFADKTSYDKVQERDLLSVVGLRNFVPRHNLEVVLYHEDGSKEGFEVQHTYNEQQIGWFRAGSTLNAR